MIKVAAAIIHNEQGEILIARRKEGKSQQGMWEFPGGKLEPGEQPEACLVRELQEEMGIEIAPYAYFGTNEHDYGSVRIRLIAYTANYISGEIQLVDHDAYGWVKRSELDSYEWAPADIPFVKQLVQEGSRFPS